MPAGDGAGGPPGKSYCYEYPRPAVTVDLAVFARFGTDLRVLLVRRKKEPFAGRWALPGGFLDIDEPVEAAARRELREETGLDVPGPVAPIGFFGDPGRDPRGRTISLAHATVVRDAPSEVAGADDAAEAAWCNLPDCVGLAFDHDAILDAALDWLRRGAAAGSLGPTLLPDEFGADEVRDLLKTVGLSPISAADWLASMLRAGRIVPTGPGEDRFRTVAGPG
jgi:8-oxo-dGTP diphosphatase